jgi:hypothetical protein
MVWVAKGAAPAYFHESAAFLGLISGDTVWEWFIPWIPILPPTIRKTSDFCAEGPPPTPAPLSDLDFVGLLPGGPIGAVLDFITLRPRLEAIALDRIFGAYCESSVSIPGSCTVLSTGLAPSSLDGTIVVDRTAFPAGYASMQLRMDLACTSGFADCHVNGFFGGAYVSDVGGQAGPFPMNLGAPHTWPIPTTTWDSYGIYTNGRGGSFTLLACGAAGTAHIPTPQAQPAGALPPATLAYPDIAALGAELDRQEFKIDQLIAMVEFLTSNAALAPATSDPPVDAAAGVKIAPHAIGYRIDVSGVPAGASESFATPTRFFKVARAAIGSVNGWLPTVEIDHTPFLIAPLPPGVDRIQVSVNAPATATITALYPPK